MLTDEPQVMEAGPRARLETVLGTPVLEAGYLTSGCANHVFRARTREGSFIVKVSKNLRPDLFGREARGLAHLGSTGTVLVPRVYHAGEDFLVLEDLGQEREGPEDRDWVRFGRRIGELHRVPGPAFGYGEDNYIGFWDQKNPWTEDGLAFFAENRVSCFWDVGRNREILTDRDRRAIERLVRALGSPGEAPGPALCHGDLWRGNVFFHRSGEFYVLDPAVHYGLPESDLAMTRMYGPFPPAFYQGYREVQPLAADWEDRLPLFQLKELLLMVAQFGHEASLQTLRESLAPFY